MNWIPLNNTTQLAAIDEASNTKPQIIFKHSTHCNVSADAKQVMDLMHADAYYLDLLSYRSISDDISTHYEVRHQSPQVLIIKEGKCIFSATHWHINLDEILEVMQDAA